MSTLASGEMLRIRLFIERVEVPVIAASVVASEGSGAVAQIEIVPTDRALALPARTTVHLFFLDYVEFERADGRDLGEGMTHAQLMPMNGEYSLESFYKLMFMGELFTMTLTKSGTGSRSIVLQCVDFSNYWDTAYLYQLRYSTDANVISGNVQTFSQGSADSTVSDLPTCDVLSNISIMAGAQTPNAAQSPAVSNVGSMLGGLFSILELVGGVPNLYSGLNAWFTVAERRARLMDQVGSDNGETAKNLFQSEVFTAFIQNQLGGMGDVISFRDIINTINQLIYYAVVPNPVGAYFAGSRTPMKTAVTKIAAGSVTLPEGTGSLDQYLGSKYKSGDALGNVWKIEAGFAADSRKIPREVIAAAIVNAVAESGLNATVQSKSPPHAVTAKYPRTAAMDAGTDETGASYKGHENSFGLFQLYYFGAGAGMSIKDRQDPTKNVAAILKDSGVDKVLAAYANGEHDVAQLAALWAVYVERPGDPVAAAQYRANLAASVFSGAQHGFSTTSNAELDAPISDVPTTRERLITQIFRPDIWFAAPPLCNIVFPEEYSNFSYTRQLMREVTRLQMDTFDKLIDDGSANSMLKKVYFAPVFPDGSGKDSLSEGGIGSASKALIYDHERMSGIIPRIERISDLSFFSAAGQATVSEAEQGDDIEKKAEEYGAQAAAFNFFRHRYAARSASVGGRFLPRLVPGMPIVVVSRPVSVGGVEPTHFIGMLVAVTHSVNQSDGGTTSFNVAYARPHKPDSSDDFIKDMTLIRPHQKEFSSTIVPNADAPSELDHIISWIDAQVTKLKKAGTLNPTSITPIPTGLLGPNGNQVLRIESVDPAPMYAEAESTTSSTAPPEEIASFSSAVVVEDSKGELLSIEDAIRPAWISADYSNASIGANFYQQLFACPAVVDVVDLASVQATVVLDASGAATTPWKDLTAVSVEVAIGKIVQDYSQVTDGGSTSGSGFIWQLTRRGYATLAQTIGDGTDDPSTWGFHKYISGPYKKLEGLNLDVPLAPKPEGVKGDSNVGSGAQLVNARMDTRSERRDIALAYQAELMADRGLRG